MSTQALSIPARAKHTATIIFAHGLGDSGAGWSFLPELFATQKLLPHIKWILPNAPNSPVTINGGMRMPSWYDITSLGDIDARVEDETGMLRSSKILHELIDKEVQAGIPSENIVIAGFSQGSAMAILTGLSHPKPLAAIVGMSGYLPLRTKIHQLASDANKATKVWLGHGQVDPVVNFRYGKLTRDTLKDLGYDVSWNEYPGLGHSAHPKEMTDLAEFLKHTVPEQ